MIVDAPRVPSSSESRELREDFIFLISPRLLFEFPDSQFQVLDNVELARKSEGSGRSRNSRCLIGHRPPAENLVKNIGGAKCVPGESSRRCAKQTLPRVAVFSAKILIFHPSQQSPFGDTALPGRCLDT
jgi:hypothetical protein